MDALRTRVPVDQGGEHNERKQDDPLQYEQLKGIACRGRGTTFWGPFAVESSQRLSYIYIWYRSRYQPNWQTSYSVISRWKRSPSFHEELSRRARELENMEDATKETKYALMAETVFTGTSDGITGRHEFRNRDVPETHVAIQFRNKAGTEISVWHGSGFWSGLVFFGVYWFPGGGRRPSL